MRRTERKRGGKIRKWDDFRLGWYWHILLTSFLDLPCSYTAMCPKLRARLCLAMPEPMALLSPTKPHCIALATTNMLKTTPEKVGFICFNYGWLVAC